MVRSIFGRKIGMTQVFDENGRIVPVTVVSAGPCTVVQVKSAENDGYNAIQVGFEEYSPKRLIKPVLGQFVKRSLKPAKILRELRTQDNETYSVGQIFSAEVLKGLLNGTAPAEGTIPTAPCFIGLRDPSALPRILPACLRV
jgi:large subunit ribosomal protein L3